MLTINVDGHEVIKHFHKPEDEIRSEVVLDEAESQPWLHAVHAKARSAELDQANSVSQQPHFGSSKVNYRISRIFW